MRFSLFNRALLPGMLAGAVAFTGTACSRPDRTESGSSNSSTVMPDSNTDVQAQPSTSVQPNSPRAETAAPSESDAAGYRPMERDTANVSDQDSDSARVTADRTETSPASSDSSVSGIPAGADTASISDSTTADYVEMARDTSTVVDQADSAATPSGDVALKTTTDTSAAAEANVAVVADETADEQIFNPDDQETVAASGTPTDEVGAAAVAGNVTGAEAVALMSRGGVRCAMIDPEANESVRWDMSSTPVTLNPCGMGSMNLSRVWAEK